MRWTRSMLHPPQFSRSHHADWIPIPIGVFVIQIRVAPHQTVIKCIVSMVQPTIFMIQPEIPIEIVRWDWEQEALSWRLWYGIASYRRCPRRSNFCFLVEISICQKLTNTLIFLISARNTLQGAHMRGSDMDTNKIAFFRETPNLQSVW